MWALRTIGWISAIILTTKFFGLRYSAWLLSALIFFVVICVLSLIVRIGISAKNPAAMWISGHAPNVMRRAGRMLSETYPQRVLFWIALLVIGYQVRDVQAYSEYTERSNWRVIAEYPAAHYPGTAYDVLLADGKTIMTEFVPCEGIGFHVGMRVSRVCYYQHAECSSFHGPRACVVKEHQH